LMDFGREYKILQRDTTLKMEPLIESDYYSFLKKMPLNDPRMLISTNYSSFIELFENSTIYVNNEPLQIDPKPAKTFLKFLVEDCNITLTPEEKEYLDFRENPSGKSLTTAQMEVISKGNLSLSNNYQTQQKAYNDSYIKPLKRTPNYEVTEIRWKRNDSTLFSKLGISPNLTTEIIRLRQLKGNLKNMNKNDGTNLVNRLDTYLTQPFFKAEAKRLLEAQYSKDTTSESQRLSKARAREQLAKQLGKQPVAQLSEQPATELPKDKAAEVFKRIIDPFKGKLVFVDFWATTCGPCIGNIERLFDFRKAYANDPEVAFVFITDISTSPFDAYMKFVKNQELVNSFRVSDGEFILFRNLFSFDAIPRCVLIGKNGNVINSNLTGDPTVAIKKYLNR